MNSPFIYIKEVVGDFFVGRNEELVWVSSNMVNGQDTVLIASSRYGKTSIMRQALLMAQKNNPSLKVCYINLFNVRSENDFYVKLANEGMKIVAGTMEDWINLTQEFFPNSKPHVEVDDDVNIIKLEFEPESLALHSYECLNFFHEYSERYSCKMTVCIEEFQNIELFEDPKFAKKLSKALKNHPNVSYVLSGGKKNAMKQLFEKPKTPFFQFGDIFTLQPMEENLLVDYIVKTFSKSGRVIKKEQAEKICRDVKCHPYYAQLYSALVWGNTKGFVTEQTLAIAENDLMDYCRKDFEEIINQLSYPQINYLKATIEGVDHFCSSESMKKYLLHSSANVARVRAALAKKEVMEFHRTKPYFLDPVFEMWFRNVYLKS